MKLGLQVAYARHIRLIERTWDAWLGWHARLLKAARTDTEIAQWLGRLGT